MADYFSSSPYSLSGTGAGATDAAAMETEALDPAVAQSIALASGAAIGGVADITSSILDYFGEGATEQAAYAAQAATAQAVAAQTASQTTVVGWATANPLTAAAVVLGTLYLLSQIAKR